MKVAFPLVAIAMVACAVSPAAAQSGGPSDPHQTALDKKFGVAPAGRWWDDMGRLCRTDHDGGKKVRRCEKPDQPSDAHQTALTRKFGPAPADHWWDDAGRLCRTDHDGGKSVRRCEKPNTSS